MKSELKNELNAAESKLESVKAEIAEAEMKLKLSGRKLATFDDADAAALARLAGRVSVSNPIIDEITTLAEDINILRRAAAIQHEKVLSLRESYGIEGRAVFLERRRKLLAARAKAVEEIVSVCDKEIALDAEIEAVGVPPQGHPFAYDTPQPQSMRNTLSTWLERFKTHQFENKG